MEILTKQYQKIGKCERAHIFFYDATRNELYKRLKTESGEIIKSIFYRF